MARFSGAKWRPLRNYTANGQEQVLGLVVHIMDGTLEGSESWFNNPTAQASSHFGTGKDGELRQWVDTKDRAWAQGSGNRTYLSIENEGRGGDSLTSAQIEAIAQTFAWVARVYDVPLKLASKVGDKGLAYHALGGSAWGGHTSCPGPKVVAQLPLIVERAKEINGEDDMPTKEEIAKAVWDYAIPNRFRGTAGKPKPTPAKYFMEWSDSHYDEIMKKLAELSAKVDKLSK